MWGVGGGEGGTLNTVAGYAAGLGETVRTERVNTTRQQCVWDACECTATERVDIYTRWRVCVCACVCVFGACVARHLDSLAQHSQVEPSCVARQLGSTYLGFTCTRLQSRPASSRPSSVAPSAAPSHLEAEVGEQSPERGMLSLRPCKKPPGRLKTSDVCKGKAMSLTAKQAARQPRD